MARRPHVVAAALIAAICVGVGLLVGVTWVRLAPRPQLVVHDGKVGVEIYSENLVAADLTLALLCLGAGVVVAAVALRWWRKLPMGVLVGCLVGAGLGSVVAWRFGLLLAGTSDSASFEVNGRADGTVFDGPLNLSAYGVLLLWSIASCALVTVYFWVRESAAKRALRARAAELHAESAGLALNGESQIEPQS